MNSINISQKAKNKHLNFSHYEFIINSLIQFNASHSGKRNTGKTQFIKELASTREFDSCLHFFTNQIAQNVDYINAFEFFYCQICENICTNMG